MAAEWINRAFCRGANPDIFDDPGHTETALAYCQRCFVRVECLTRALSLLPRVEGVWGGTTDTDRMRILRGGRRRTCPICHSRAVQVVEESQACVLCGFTWKLQLKSENT